MKLGRKNILTQGCPAVEMELDKVSSCQEEPHGSIAVRWVHALERKNLNQVKFYFIAPIACLQSHNLDGAWDSDGGQKVNKSYDSDRGKPVLW